ncbi:MAG: tRNA lysidine(34) synthetase TilS [Acidobacteriota bacterium]
MMIPAFRKAVEARGLLAAHDVVLAAVSGGGDSVSLLRLLLAYSRTVPLSIIVAHVNHRVRGVASDADQRFVEDLARGLDLKCLVLARDRVAGAESGASLSEERLRRLRHALLEEAAREAGVRRVALGHTLDDQAETVLMRMLRGAGRRGLSGMAYAGPGRLIRPLLGLRRADLRDYLREIGQEFREDQTNADRRFLRNRIRAGLLPRLEEFNPSIVRTLGRSAELMAEEDRYLDGLAAERVAHRIETWPAGHDPAGGATGVAIPSDVLAGLPLPLARRGVRLLLEKVSPDPRATASSAVEAVLDLVRGRSRGGERGLGRGLQAARSGGRLIIREAAASPAGTRQPFSAALRIPGEITLPGGAGRIEVRLMGRSEAASVPPSRGRACLDADRLGAQVTVRSRREGDRFHPLGAPGRRKLKEFFIDEKIPASRRDGIPLVVGPEGIAWVVGRRIGNAYRLTEITRRVAVLEFRVSVDSGDS